MPFGIAVDESNQRIYWTDMRQGIYSRIESTNVDGKEREILHEGKHQMPFGIATDKEYVYWTDMNNNALLRKKKNSSESPETLHSFNERPMGVIARNSDLFVVPDCDKIMKKLVNYSLVENDEVEMSTETQNAPQCLNNGIVTEQGCKCSRGFTGNNCEISLCYNYCLHGDCHFSSTGYPQCHCPPGYYGYRCEKKACDGFCLNGGTCNTDKNSKWGATCLCPNGFVGSRCEISTDPVELCGILCRTKSTDVFFDETNSFLCRCENGIDKLSEENLTSFERMPLQNRESLTLIQKIKDPIFIVMASFLAVMLIVVFGLFILVCKMKKRPRIKKRIIVNKNVTPLTYRPQPTSEQCEITIENCCNMNVCETVSIFFSKFFIMLP